jgi:hypothetical protein
MQCYRQAGSERARTRPSGSVLVRIILTRLWAMACAVLLLTSSGLAQLNRGQISGFVKDASSAFVANAGITLTEEATSWTTRVSSNESGYWRAPNLPPGYYTVSIEANGFKKYTETKVKLDALSEVSVNATLELGAVTESIEVVGSVARVQADSAQVGRVIESRQIADLTLNGRNPILLQMLKPGVRGSSIDQFIPDNLGTGGVSINGGADPTVTIDGALASPRTRGQGMLGVLNADAVEEMQVLTANYAAEYGRSTNGRVVFVTKGGGRSFHGSLWEYFRNDALDSNTWARNNNADPKISKGPAPLRFNQPGFTLSGPVFIPNVFNQQRDKLFFFWGEEWIRWRQYGTATATVPTQLMRHGDFSELLNPSNPFFSSARTVYDPLVNQPFPNNVIPESRLSPNGTAMLGVYPLPTPGFQQGSANFTDFRPNPRDTRKDTIRVDYNLHSMHRLSFRGDHFSWVSVDAFSGSFFLAPTSWKRPNYTSILNLTSTLSPTLINEASFSANVDRVITTIYEEAPYQRSLYGINYPYVFPLSVKDVDAFPNVSTTGFTSITRPSYPSKSAGPIFTWSDNVTKVSGNHTFKFGMFLEHSGQNDRDQGCPQSGQFTFQDTGTPMTTGVAIANEALGIFNSYSECGAKTYEPTRATMLDLFAQDGWKVTPNLKLEYGLRWMYWPFWKPLWGNEAQFNPKYFDRNNMAVVDPKTGVIVSGDRYNGLVFPGSGWPKEAIGRVAVASDPSFDRLFHDLPPGFIPTPRDVFDPRFGIAYSVNSKTVVRTAFGMFHQRDNVSAWPQAPFQTTIGINNGNVDYPAGGSSPVYPFTSSRNKNPDWKIGTALNWNFTVQRELPGGSTIEVAYVGRRAYHSGGPDGHQININQLPLGTVQANPGINPDALRPYRGWGYIRYAGVPQDSHYHSLQVAYERRFNAGLGFNVAYTWSKSIDNAENPLPNAFDDRQSRGLSSFDTPHILIINYVYEIPLLRNNKGMLGKLAGGWELSGVNQFQSGTPSSVTYTTDYAGVGTGSGNQHWNLVGDPHVSNPKFSDSLNDQNYYFNPLAFAAPAAGTWGNAGRNILRGPGIIAWDLGVRKNFRITERTRIQFRTEAYNLLNHPNWSSPDVGPTSRSFGRVSAKSGNRTLQLALRFEF